MEYNKPICSLQVNDEIEGFYILKAAFSKVASNGRPFLNATLSDITGIISAKVWDYGGPIGSAEEGKIIKIRGSVSEFRGTLQVTIDRIRLAEPQDNVDLSLLVPVAPIEQQKELEHVRALLNSIEDADYRELALALLNRHEVKFANIPAAKSVHHGFLQGLLMHTGNMLRAADFFAALYQDTIDRSLLLAGTVAHDLQKETEFVFSELGLVTE